MEEQIVEKKYYTPEIEEFHVGFEFEKINPISGEYESDVFGKMDIPDVLAKCEVYRSRIKHLDREDIESLGFGVAKEPYRWQFTKDNYMLVTGTYTSKEDVPQDTISIGDQRYDDTIFRGTIKNKSELKRLLKQLGI